MKASICIPTVNRLAFFQEALESAASQTFEDYEILVSVNSTDPGYHERVAAVVESVNGRHPARTIRTVRPPRFLHIADHTNFLVDQARGAYWCYLADDDRMEPQFLETLVGLLDAHDDAMFAFSDFLVIDGTGAIRPDLGAKFTRATHRDRIDEEYIPHSSLARLALWNAIWFPCCLFRRTLLQDFPFDSGNEAADRAFWLRLADSAVGLAAAYTPTRLLHYRLHSQQYTRVSSRGQSDLIRALESCYRVAKSEPHWHNRELAYVYAKLGKALLDEGDRSGAWQALRVALHKNAFDRRIHRFVLQTALPSAGLRHLRRLRERARSH